MAITKQMIQQSIRDQFMLPDAIVSGHLKIDRWVLKTRRVLTEMLETYRYTRGLMLAGDRDNDDTFIPDLIYLGLDHRVLECPFELDKTEPKCAEYSLKLNMFQKSDYDRYRLEKGWTRQKLIANCVYTGILYTYPAFTIGSQWKVKVLEYHGAVYQPNLEWMDLNGHLVTIVGDDVKEDPWIECVDNVGKNRHLRKNFLFANIRT